MKRINKYLLPLASLVLAGTVGAQERLDAWGDGPSAFEAVKAGYKQLLARALELPLAEASNQQSTIRQTLDREIEEDLLRFQRTLFPEALPPQCTQVEYHFQCRVAAPVNVIELNAAVRALLQVTGQGGASIGSYRLALIASSDAPEVADLTTWLHATLERDFGYDIYYSAAAVDPGALQNRCAQYQTLADEYRARGANYQETTQKLLGVLAACQQLLDRDVIIVVDEVKSRYDDFVPRGERMSGELRVRLQILEAGSPRSLAPPPETSIDDTGYGESSAAARSDLQDRLYKSTANYLAQQLNAVLDNLTRRLGPQAGERQYRVTLSGVLQDSADDRAKVRLVTGWLEDEAKYALEADSSNPDVGTRVYRFTASSTPNWDRLIDELYGVLDDRGIAAVIDADGSGNVTVAFAAPAGEAIAVVLEHDRLRSRIEIEQQSMVLRRRDPETGNPITINEAVVRIRNDERRELILSVTPRWIGQDGATQPAAYSQEQFLRLPGRSSEEFIFRAPSRFSRSVTLAIDCPATECLAPR